jgi:hypothetical protein
MTKRKTEALYPIFLSVPLCLPCFRFPAFQSLRHFVSVLHPVFPIASRRPGQTQSNPVKPSQTWSEPAPAARLPGPETQNPRPKEGVKPGQAWSRCSLAEILGDESFGANRAFTGI